MTDSPSETPPPDSDLELVRRAQAGDEAAFGTLMQTHHEPIFRLVFSILRNEEDARDVAQEVWLSVWKTLSKFRGDAKFTTWVHPIAVRRSVDHLRKRRRWFDLFLPFASSVEDPDSATLSAPEPLTTSDPRREAETAERDEEFESALATLPPKLRAALALREVQGLSYEEIARTLHCRQGTAMSRIFNARRLLAQKLGDPS